MVGWTPRAAATSRMDPSLTTKSHGPPEVELDPGPAELGATPLRGLEPGRGPLPEQLPFQLGHGGDDGEAEPLGQCARVDGVVHGDEVDAPGPAQSTFASRFSCRSIAPTIFALRSRSVRQRHGSGKPKIRGARRAGTLLAARALGAPGRANRTGGLASQQEGGRSPALAARPEAARVVATRSARPRRPSSS